MRSTLALEKRRGSRAAAARAPRHWFVVGPPISVVRLGGPAKAKELQQDELFPGTAEKRCEGTDRGKHLARSVGFAPMSGAWRIGRKNLRSSDPGETAAAERDAFHATPCSGYITEPNSLEGQTDVSYSGRSAPPCREAKTTPSGWSRLPVYDKPPPSTFSASRWEEVVSPSLSCSIVMAKKHGDTSLYHTQCAARRKVAAHCSRTNTSGPARCLVEQSNR